MRYEKSHQTNRSDSAIPVHPGTVYLTHHPHRIPTKTVRAGAQHTSRATIRWASRLNKLRHLVDRRHHAILDDTDK